MGEGFKVSSPERGGDVLLLLFLLLCLAQTNCAGRVGGAVRVHSNLQMREEELQQHLNVEFDAHGAEFGAELKTWYSPSLTSNSVMTARSLMG